MYCLFEKTEIKRKRGRVGPFKKYQLLGPVRPDINILFQYLAIYSKENWLKAIFLCQISTNAKMPNTLKIIPNPVTLAGTEM